MKRKIMACILAADGWESAGVSVPDGSTRQMFVGKNVQKV